MAEIVGVAATATQLVVVCVSLLDLMKRIKAGSSTLKRYHQQLNELRGVSESISTNPLLQTAEVGGHTQTLLAIIDNNSLTSLLQKGRFLRTLALLHKERDLLDTFSLLERHKTNLSLLIEDIQARALHQIQSDIRIMANRPSVSQITSLRQDSEIEEAARNSSSTSPVASTALVRHSWSSTQPVSGRVEEASVSSLNFNHAMNSTQRSQEDQQCPDRAQPGPGMERWSDCTIASGHQINGFLSDTTAKQVKMEFVPVPGYFSYKGCSVNGSGTQVNGLKSKSQGGDEPVVLPLVDGYWQDCRVTGKSPKVQQVNGVYHYSAKEDESRREK
ncbi:hypothetical protein QQZ08_008234 [Neonectria magnoliae]|uniref:Fungal N-terminal domain-containing protein n=1 Tax=Neonectria magnoliae TaxID=2732573 RepID=A0ABR1HVW9_9HYPO